MSDTPIPEGWCLTSESWSFHRQFYARVGRPAEHDEFTFIRAQIRRRTAEPLGGRFYRVTLADGAPLVVEGGWNRLTGAEAADWTPPAKAMPRPPQAESHPAINPEPPPRQPLRASTLTLGNPGAAVVLAARLRRFGIPEHAISQPAPP